MLVCARMSLLCTGCSMFEFPLIVFLLSLAAADSAPRMFLSSATLVIVPVTLIPHWQQQVGIEGSGVSYGQHQH